MSPATAKNQAIAMSRTMSISPCPATTPATMIAVSPGMSRPTNAPASRNARIATSRYVHFPSARPMSSRTWSIDGSSTTPVE